MSKTPSQRAMADVDKVAEAIWRADPFRMGDPDAFIGTGDQQAYRTMAIAAIDALGLTEEWSDDVAGPEWCRYRRLVTESESVAGPKRIAAGLT